MSSQEATADLRAIPAHVPAHLVTNFDIYAPAAPGEDFHAAWVRFQASTDQPYLWSPRYGGHWIAMRGEDLIEIHADSEAFSSVRNVLPPVARPVPLGALVLDPPDHADFRAFLSAGLSPRVVRGVEPDVRALAEDLVAAIAPRGACDFVADYADVLPLTVFLRLADLPVADRTLLAGWAAENTRNPDPQARNAAARNIRGYLRPVLAQRRARPGEDLLSRVVRAQVQGRPITEAEALGAATHLTIAGLDTVASLLGFVMRFLASHPGHRRALVDDPGLIPGAVKELIRRFPLVIQSREVRRDLTRNGVAFRAGDLIAVPSMLYNLDARIYPDPLAVDWRRSVMATCSFGAGIHRCPGAPLGQRELAMTLETWLAAIPDFEIDPERAPAQAQGGIVATLDRLPLRWR
ncbi:cytochrome P450 [uncultured Phenylobacterium sp.]|uniref:cytochrome P450 n=1 Tax=uncultured Phenylobacterium sp. TaxID=349273 RepID=UPI0025EF266D|nr:cytochrome P450 [uncultured Phenylobacterium sp.]